MYVAIEGVIGVGKTTLARLLQSTFNAEILLEVFEENPFLSDFYADRERYAFQTQIFFLLSRYHQQRRTVHELLATGKNLFADYTFAKDALFAQINLKGDELDMYYKVHEALAEKISLKKAGIRGIFCGGTEMTPQFVRFAVEELLEGAYLAPTYGNTLMGLACSKPVTAEENYKISYYAPQPRAVAEVVDFKDSDRVVGYGQTGRVKLTTLTKEFFVPGFLERDEGEREPPCDTYPWDGVSGVRPFRGFAATTTVGVY